MKTIANTPELKKNLINFAITASAVFVAALAAFALAGPRSKPANAVTGVPSGQTVAAVTSDACQAPAGGAGGTAGGAVGQVLGATTTTSGGSGGGSSTTTSTSTTTTGSSGNNSNSSGNTTSQNGNNADHNNNSGIGLQDLVDVNTGDIASNDSVLDNSLNNNNIPVLSNNLNNATTTVGSLVNIL